MTLNDFYSKREKTEDEQVVSDFLHWFIDNFGNIWFHLHQIKKADEMVQKLYEMRVKKCDPK